MLVIEKRNLINNFYVLLCNIVIYNLYIYIYNL